MVDGFDHVAFGNLNELRAAITDNTAGIMIEPIQGEGVRLPVWIISSGYGRFAMNSGCC